MSGLRAGSCSGRVTAQSLGWLACATNLGRSWRNIPGQRRWLGLLRLAGIGDGCRLINLCPAGCQNLAPSRYHRMAPPQGQATTPPWPGASCRQSHRARAADVGPLPVAVRRCGAQPRPAGGPGQSRRACLPKTVVGKHALRGMGPFGRGGPGAWWLDVPAEHARTALDRPVPGRPDTLPLILPPDFCAAISRGGRPAPTDREANENLLTAASAHSCGLPLAVDRVGGCSVWVRLRPGRLVRRGRQRLARHARWRRRGADHPGR